jgi:hypothetical protein
MRKMLLAASVGLALAAVTAQADSYFKWEQKPRVVEDRFRVELGIFDARFDTRARVDAGNDAVGTQFNAENDFGLAKSKYLPLIEVTLLPGERHLLRFNALSIMRSGHQPVSRVIDYDVDTFAPGDFVDSNLDLKLRGLTYGYRLLKRDRFEADILLGVEDVEFNTNAEIRGKTQREPSGDNEPIPLPGLELRVDLTDRWSVEARAQYFSVNIQQVSGAMTDARAAVTWRMNPYLVFGLGYKQFSVNAESTNADSAGLLHLKMSGPALFLRTSL